MEARDCYILLCATRELLTDLKRCGIFYYSAIEIDIHVDNSIDGEEFEEKINSLLEKINEHNE
ncbi:hypothetical protein LCGC14_1458780 [marine sediment metagenome]|uniref:Uncharacterized protein n=1 Tax=marine sediment metagenome TaxID=412755 RepID=A0A0F9MHN4_9ZZZZ